MNFREKNQQQPGTMFFYYVIFLSMVANLSLGADGVPLSKGKRPWGIGVTSCR